MALSTSKANILLKTEWLAIATVGGIYSLRMLGLFMIMPLFTSYAKNFLTSDQLLIGVALGGYGLTQALLQIPYGLLSDKFGRRAIIVFGLSIFVLGSLLGFLYNNIYAVISARLLQGAGAIGCVLMATVFDLTRENVRSRAMAGLGGTIALSFVIALVVGPLLQINFGLQGIFCCTAILGLVSLCLTFLFIPKNIQPQNVFAETDLLTDNMDNNTLSKFKAALEPRLLKLYFGVFLLHASLALLFCIAPSKLLALGIVDAKVWQCYLQILLCALLFALVIINHMEKKKRFVFGHLTALSLLVASFVVLLSVNLSLRYLLINLTLFFIGFCTLEASLPAQLSRSSLAFSRGTAMGIFSSMQFLGVFIGGLIGGLIF